MIAIKRTKIAPSFSRYPIFKKMKQELKRHYEIPQSKRRQQKPPYIPLPGSVLEKVRGFLLKDFNGKCAYCESLITTTNHGDFDHFRPKSSARGIKEEFDLDHYWTLAFDWRNMYLCCEICNRYKLNWFPVEGKRALISQTFSQILKTEITHLIDPCHEDPSLHLFYKENGQVMDKSKKGKITIDILKLNRKDLVENRLERYEELHSIITKLSGKARSKEKNKPLTLSDKSALNTLSDWIGEITKIKPTRDFIGIQRYFLEKWFKEDIELVKFLLHHDSKKIIRKYVSKIGISVAHLSSNKLKTAKAYSDKSPSAKETSSKSNTSVIRRFSIESIEIENFKSIESLQIKFPVSQKRKEPWLMLLGENGVGKSSFLQALALTLMGEQYRKSVGVKPSDILRNGSTKGFVKINQTDKPPIELHFTKSIIHNSNNTASTYLLAYGSTRLFPTVKIKPERTKGKIRARNMFSPETALFADNWLITLYETDRKKFDFAARALKAMLKKELEDPEIRFTVKDKDVYLYYSDKKKSPDKLRTLSDGYKSIIALACDMMQALMQGNSTMEVAEGIVLIDEIGTHLHPRWKMRVVSSFREAFPKLQFIVTTHDPLCLKGLYAGEISVFDKNESGQVFAISDLPDPGEYRADQLLASRFFGLNSTIDDELEKEFNEYYKLLGKKDTITASEKKRLEELKEILRGKKHLGNSLREELAFNAVDSVLSEEIKSETATPVEELKQKTINFLQDLWDKPISEKENIVKA